MTVFDENLTPVLKSNVDFSRLAAQPTPEEFFVLSRVNGQLTITQLCAVTGLGREKTLSALQKLRDVGLLTIPGSAEPPTSPPAATPLESTPVKAPPEPVKTKDKQSNKKRAPNYALLPVAFSDFKFDQDLLDQQVELDDTVKREILYVFDQLNDVNYYQLLGVAPTADRKEIRNGYFALSRRFHPDLFFRKLLGDYEPRLEKLFQHTVKAYETLSHRKKRAAYDESLAITATQSPASVNTDRPGSGETAQTTADRKRELAFTILVNRADTHAAAMDWPQACEGYKNALRIKRDRDLALRVAKALLETQTQNEQALIFAHAALKMDQDCIDALLILGELYQMIDAHDKALSHYRRALEIEPTRLDIRQRIELLSS